MEKKQLLDLYQHIDSFTHYKGTVALHSFILDKAFK